MGPDSLQLITKPATREEDYPATALHFVSELQRRDETQQADRHEASYLTPNDCDEIKEGATRFKEVSGALATPWFLRDGVCGGGMDAGCYHLSEAWMGRWVQEQGTVRKDGVWRGLAVERTR